MSQAPQDKGSSPSLRTVMPDPLRLGRKIQKKGFGPDFKGFPRSTFFLFVLLVLPWCVGAALRVHITYPFWVSVFSAVHWGASCLSSTEGAIGISNLIFVWESLANS